MPTSPPTTITTSTTTLPFITLDIFTHTPYTGNPLAIIFIPPPRSTTPTPTITQAQKQRIAKEFNLSETVFFHLTQDESGAGIGDGDGKGAREYKIDIFTTDEELPFAGHPVIGAAYWALVLSPDSHRHPGGKEGVLITKAGRIPISFVPPSGVGGDGAGQGEEGLKVKSEVPFNTYLHAHTLSTSSSFSSSSLGLGVGVRVGVKGEQHRGLQPHPEIRKCELEAPLYSIVKGMAFLLIELPSLELLQEVEITGFAPSWGEVLDTEDGWGGGFVGRYYYVMESRPGDRSEKEEGKYEGGKGEGEDENEVVKIRTRMIEAKMEDPATGSAACALGCYLAESWGREGKGMGKGEGKRAWRFEIVQGVEMGRISVIGVEVQVEEEGNVDGVALVGGAVGIMEGVVRG